MKRTIGILCVVTAMLVAGNVCGQKKTSSYKLYKSRSTERDITGLLNEADILKESDPARALDKVKEALGISVATGDAFNEAKCHLLLGGINENIREWKLALENYNIAYQKLATSHSSSPEYLAALQGLGNNSLKLDLFDQALQCFNNAVALTTNDSQKVELYLNISEAHYQMGNYPEALRFVQSIMEENKTLEPSLEARARNQEAKIAARTNEPVETKELYDNSLNTLRQSGSVEQKEEESLQSMKDEIANVLRQQKRFDDEIDLRTQSIRFNAESKNFAEVTKDKVEISKTLDAKGDTEAALREIEEAARIADTIDNPKQQANAFLTLADLYEKNGRNSQALKAYRKYSEAVANMEVQNESQLLEKSLLIRKQRDIEELTKDVYIGQREDTIERAMVSRQQLIIYGLLLIILVGIVTSYLIFKNAQASRVANQLLALKSLRSQMNPHFIFNALNSVNQFIAQQDERTANKFLSEFSQLMRLVLENSQEDFIPLYKEQEILSLYLKLEHYRFRDKFDYEITVDENLNADAIEVPPMLIQPYIENAVWHGLRYKETKGKLSLGFHKEENDLIVRITDNGIGRKRSAELKTENQKKHNSTGLKNIQQRLTLINKVYHSNYRVSIEDLPENTGTSVRIHLPLTNAINAA